MHKQLILRYLAIKPKYSISCKQFLKELAECEIAQRRATIARQKILPTNPPSLNKWERLFISQSKHPEHFPENLGYLITYRKQSTRQQKGAL